MRYGRSLRHSSGGNAVKMCLLLRYRCPKDLLPLSTALSCAVSVILRLTDTVTWAYKSTLRHTK